MPTQLEPSFTKGMVDKSIGDAVTGLGQMADSVLYDPFGTLPRFVYDMTLGKVVDAGRGIAFAWDMAWGTGTARSDVDQFVEQQKLQMAQDATGYYTGSVLGQAFSYLLFGRAFRSLENKHSDHGGAGTGKIEQRKNQETAKFELTEPGSSSGGAPKENTEARTPMIHARLSFKTLLLMCLLTKGIMWKCCLKLKVGTDTALSQRRILIS
ncbi:hypothetical protein [Paenibacillus sp. 2003]|uniref:hypothetical protein n=1 Tax=Paenibacillus TaxID=44249 RepID=UPI002863E646|nr:hypothetical protein [Paenibacillus sp. 2003]MDR6720556.1 hypothetical protein [Paenibacillus sp. 2003]